MTTSDTRLCYQTHSITPNLLPFSPRAKMMGMISTIGGHPLRPHRSSPFPLILMFSVFQQPPFSVHDVWVEKDGVIQSEDTYDLGELTFPDERRHDRRFMLFENTCFHEMGRYTVYVNVQFQLFGETTQATIRRLVFVGEEGKP